MNKPTRPLIPSASEPSGSPTLFPNDHVRMLVELLRPTGPELSRRWLSALALVPEHERLSLVEAIERKIVQTYAPPAAPPAGASGEGSRRVRVIQPPVQREGYVEQIQREYEVLDADGADESKVKPTKRRRAQ